MIACGVVGFLCAVFLLAFLAYRMKKKDEGSYDLGDTKLSNTQYQRAPTKEFYAWTDRKGLDIESVSFKSGLRKLKQKLKIHFHRVWSWSLGPLFFFFFHMSTPPHPTPPPTHTHPSPAPFSEWFVQCLWGEVIWDQIRVFRNIPIILFSITKDPTWISLDSNPLQIQLCP